MIFKLKKYLKDQKTGQIVIRFKDEPYLCKISIEAGEVVYISIGNKPPKETIEYIKNKEITDLNFIEGIKSFKRADSPLTEELLKIFGVGKDGATLVETDLEVIPFAKVKDAMEFFIDIIGPLGPVLLEKIFKELGYEKGRPMDGALYSEFLSRLLEEIPDERKGLFKDKIL